MTNAAEKRLSFALLVGPSVLIYAAVIIFPVLFSFVLGFTKWGGFTTPEWVGLDNYRRMLADPVFRLGLRNNILVVAVSLFGQIPFGFLLAYIIYRKLVLGSRFFETMIFFAITVWGKVVAKLWDQIL